MQKKLVGFLSTYKLGHKSIQNGITGISEKSNLLWLVGKEVVAI